MFFIVLFYFTTYPLDSCETGSKSVIVCIKGTCSSGKSTLINSISSAFQDLVIVDEDSIVFMRYREEIAKRFPNQFARICEAVDVHNLYHTLRTEDICFKNNATGKQCQQAIDAVVEIQNELNKIENLSWKKEVSNRITDEVLNIIQLAVQQDKNILLDAWYVTANHIKELYPEICVIKALIYCSLPIAYERLLERNKEALAKGILSKKRLIGQLLGSFRDLYEFNYDSTKSLEEIDKKNYYKTFKRILQTLPDRAPTSKPVFTFREISRQETKKMYNNLIVELSEDNINRLYVIPKDNYEVIINNTYSDSINIRESFKKIFLHDNR